MQSVGNLLQGKPGGGQQQLGALNAYIFDIVCQAGNCFPQRKGGGSERAAGQSKKQRQGDCKMNAINWKKLLYTESPR